MSLENKRRELLFTISSLAIFIIAMNIWSNQHASLWTFMLVPIMFVIVLYPSWRITHTVILSMSAIKYIIFFFIHKDVVPDMIDNHVVATVINWSVIYTFAFIRMRMEKLKQELHALTITDPLTGAYNRRYVETYLNKELERSERARVPLFGIMIDVNNFKLFNDNYGHHTGDEILRNVVNGTSREIRHSDDIIRMGGDEFLVLLYNSTIQDGMVVMQRIQDAVSESISLGGSSYIPGESREVFIRRLDKALYIAKAEETYQAILKEE